MARVKTFYISDDRGVNDLAVAAFIQSCEDDGFYVSVTTQFIPSPSPRLCVIVTKLDHREVVTND